MSRALLWYAAELLGKQDSAHTRYIHEAGSSSQQMSPQTSQVLVLRGNALPDVRARFSVLPSVRQHGRLKTQHTGAGRFQEVTDRQTAWGTGCSLKS